MTVARRSGPAWRRWVALGASMALAVSLLTIALHLRDPRLLTVRPAATGGVIFLGVAAALACAWRCRRSGWRDGLLPGLALVWLAGPTLAIEGEVRLARQRAAVLGSGEAGAELGRHFLVGYTDLRSVAPLAARGLIGGVFVTTRNVAGRDAAALRAEIAALQALRREAGWPPLFVATDQEGGLVSRLSPPLPASPAPSAFAGLAGVEREAAARAAGASQGAGLAGLGINVNFAPVLDLRRPGPAGHPPSPIAERAISDDPAVVAAVGLAYVRGLAEAGIAATAKHFPGLGRATVDTHHTLARIDAPRQALEAEDLAPFRFVLGEAGAWVMLAHATVAALDPDRPASMSARVVTGLLRGEWGYEGVVVTDDLNMAPIVSSGLCGAVVSALSAGVDLLLLSWDPDRYYPAMACALEARRRGALDAARLAESRGRLARAMTLAPRP